jgi:hypothetical protein
LNDPGGARSLFYRLQARRTRLLRFEMLLYRRKSLILRREGD